MVNHYKILGLELGATNTQIKKQFRKLAFLYHPDTNPGNANAAAMMQKINESYDVLSDPQKKNWHDFQLKNQNQSAYSNRPISPYTSSKNYAKNTGDVSGGVNNYASSSQEFRQLAKKIVGCFIILVISAVGLLVYAIYSAFSK